MEYNDNPHIYVQYENCNNIRDSLETIYYNSDIVEKIRYKFPDIEMELDDVSDFDKILEEMIQDCLPDPRTVLVATPYGDVLWKDYLFDLISAKKKK